MNRLVHAVMALPLPSPCRSSIIIYYSIRAAAAGAAPAVPSMTFDEGPRYPWGPGDSHLETRREPPLGPGRDAERCRTMGGDVTS
ncbi:unnamed protein product [Lampetra planeri]